MNYEEHGGILEDDDFDQSFSERKFGLSTPKFLLVIAISCITLLYLWILVFGDNSILILVDLEEYQDFLTDDIERLKSENAALQKQFFELQELDSGAPIPPQGDKI